MPFYILFILILLLIPQSVAAQNVRVSGFEEFDFGSWDMRGRREQINDTTCVFRDDGNHRYRITATDDTGTSGFYAENDAGTYAIPIEVKWKNNPSGGGYTLVEGVSKNRINASTNHELCAIDGDVANMRVRFEGTDLEAAPAGTYRAEITVTVEPR